MTIEEAEVVFGKRWNKWTRKEWDEFLEDIEPSQLRIPGILNQVVNRMNTGKRNQYSSEVLAELTRIMLN